MNGKTNEMEMPRTVLCNSLQTAQTLSVVTGLGLIATIAAPSDKLPSIALMIILPLIILFSGVAAFKDRRTDAMIKKHNAPFNDDGSYVDMETTAKSQATYLPELADFMHRVDLGLRLSRFSAVVISGSGVSLMILLIVRLILGQYHFEGYPPTVDFGALYGDQKSSLGSNIDFSLTWYSVANCLQGILASFLVFPAVVGTLSRLASSGGSDRLIFAASASWVVVFVEVLAGLMTIYPTYSFLRGVLVYPESFASSPFMKNGFEWALGFLFGISLGCLVTAFTRTKFRRQFPSISRHSSKAKKMRFREDDYERPLAYGLFSDHKNDMSPCSYWTVSAIRAILGVMLVFSVIGATVFTAETWNSCRGDMDKSCINYSVDEPSLYLTFGFAAIPIVSYLVAMFMSRDFSN